LCPSSANAASTSEAARYEDGRAFRFLLRLADDGDPFDPPALVTAVPNWEVGEVVMLAPDDDIRIVEIDTEIDQQLIDLGFNAIWFVEPVSS